VTLDRFVYNPDRGTGRVQIEANRGVFRFVTGSQDKKDYEIVTPSGTIHVKGTEFQLLVDKGYIIVALESGALTVTTNKGRVLALDQPGTSLTVHKDGRVEGPTPFSGTITQYANAQFPYFVSALPPAINLATSLTTFTGCYVGAQVGGSGGPSSINNAYSDSYLESPLGGGPSFAHASNTQQGFAAGGLSGCSYQFGPVVVGGEAEYGYSGQNSSETIPGGTVTTYAESTTCPPGYGIYPGSPGGSTNCYNPTSGAGPPVVAPMNAYTQNQAVPEHVLRQTFNMTGVGRARATVGYAILPNLLFYVSGGWTLASTNTSLGGAVTTPSQVSMGHIISTSQSLVSASNNKLVNGENVGFGSEYAFTRNLIARVEYIYDRLAPNYNYGFLAVNGVSKTSVNTNENTVRAALLFKF
jgi:opacity protein-like surface antigen